MEFRKLAHLLLPALIVFAAAQARAESGIGESDRMLKKPDVLTRVKMDPKAANGDCLPGFAGEPETVLAANRITITRASGSPVENPIKYAVARLANAMSEIGSGEFTAHHGLNIVINSTLSFYSPYSGWDPDRIILDPAPENRMPLRLDKYGGVNNYGLLAAEIGGMVAARTGYDIRYAQAIESPCEISVASVASRRIEFNEVFAAYVTNPSLLYRKSAACESARLFMARHLFRESPVRSKSCATRFKSLRRIKND